MSSVWTQNAYYRDRLIDNISVLQMHDPAIVNFLLITNGRGSFIYKALLSTGVNFAVQIYLLSKSAFKPSVFFDVFKIALVIA